MSKTKINGAQTGEVTIHQDHVITLHNFSTMSKIKSNPSNPVPLLVMVLSLIVVFVLAL